ncbi:hypothetical protein GUJ93_ZPchr0010g8629 [Zizania palustris]|uniref:Uncharacterized protein n=1 Tax=Zizania palustris TaxID=103762 RepID=A0A8J5WAQ6_ZIZPA|nr:hypothetical protein GUJ93_ZPchr0010g8629 [Zizania palustris]
MTSLVSQPRRSIQMYWMRRSYSYQRLGPTSRHLRVARLGGRRNMDAPAPRARAGRGVSWKARTARALLLLSPVRLLTRIRDAYVDAMLALAGGAGRRPCAALAKTTGLWDKRVPRARHGSARSGDFERRMMEHIYNMLVTPELPGATAAVAARA